METTSHVTPVLAFTAIPHHAIPTVSNNHNSFRSTRVVSSHQRLLCGTGSLEIDPQFVIILNSSIYPASSPHITINST